MHDFVSRSEAKTRGLRHYFNGKRCKHGHVAPRFTSTSACCGCSEGKPPDPPEAERRRLINDFKWDDDIRSVLIDEYVNTGDIMQAREMVKCSAAAYHRHLEENQKLLSSRSPRRRSLPFKRSRIAVFTWQATGQRQTDHCHPESETLGSVHPTVVEGR